MQLTTLLPTLLLLLLLLLLPPTHRKLDPLHATSKAREPNTSIRLLTSYGASRGGIGRAAEAAVVLNPRYLPALAATEKLGMRSFRLRPAVRTLQDTNR
jgi:hypothetical protein